MTLDWDSVLGRPAGPSWSLVANLPYNIATPLVLDLLAGVPAIERMLVMVQREVGERLAARPGDEAYGIPSVKVAYRASAEVVGRVPPTVFIPPPRVESVLVRLRRLPAPPVDADPGRAVPAGGGRASASAARCCAARWPAWSTRRRSPRRACAPRPGPRSWRWRTGPGWRRPMWEGDRHEQPAGTRPAPRPPPPTAPPIPSNLATAGRLRRLGRAGNLRPVVPLQAGAGRGRQLRRPVLRQPSHAGDGHRSVRGAHGARASGWCGGGPTDRRPAPRRS